MLAFVLGAAAMALYSEMGGTKPRSSGRPSAILLKREFSPRGDFEVQVLAEDADYGKGLFCVLDRLGVLIYWRKTGHPGDTHVLYWGEGMVSIGYKLRAQNEIGTCRVRLREYDYESSGSLAPVAIRNTEDVDDDSK